MNPVIVSETFFPICHSTDVWPNICFSIFEMMPLAFKNKLTGVVEREENHERPVQVICNPSSCTVLLGRGCPVSPAVRAGVQLWEAGCGVGGVQGQRLLQQQGCRVSPRAPPPPRPRSQSVAAEHGSSEPGPGIRTRGPLTFFILFFSDSKLNRWSASTTTMC